MSSAELGKAVVVTTKHSGVFYGYFDGDLDIDGPITLTNARMAVYWDVAMHSVMGLAAKGPSKKCRISPAVPCLTVNGVTAIMPITDKAAIEAWEAEPWA